MLAGALVLERLLAADEGMGEGLAPAVAIAKAVAAAATNKFGVAWPESSRRRSSAP